ncbi:uncharacterized protein G6M90_00g020920 [Metarhizium brunneum]|uniref:Uncharacterized protein n=1 Tax=Metarhizium brunneum TaxID=500148 RepID=A0A7D5YMZ6_9HYPO
MASWKAQILNSAATYKRAIQTGDFSKIQDDKSKYSDKDLKSMANEFPEVKVVMEDQATYHSGITDEHQAVTEDLESGHADKPTAIERVKAQGEKMKAESIANIDASTQRVLALLEGLPEDQQQRAADFWDALGNGFMLFWSTILTQVERIFEFVVEWLSQVWEQVKAAWQTVKGVWTQIWAWLQGLLS